jgi:GntR family transcriptional regulator, transcriptional repressor for pyruvate dehydrogenase complex
MIVDNENKPVAATDLVVAKIRTAVEAGELKSGDRLEPERELATRYGVSRPSIRSGLKTLAGMGVVQIRRGAGTFITSGPPALGSEPLDFLAALHGISRKQLFEARIALEVSVAGYAAERATAEHLVAIGDETVAMFAVLDNPDAFLTHDIRFHRSIAEASENPALSAMVEMVSSIFQKARAQTIRWASDLHEAAAEHRAIYQAIRNHDPERAKAAMLAHLRRAERTQTAEPERAHAPAPAAGNGRTGKS